MRLNRMKFLVTKVIMVLIICALFGGFNTVQASGKTIFRANIEQNPKSFPDDPRVLGTLKFQELMKEKVGDKFEMQIFWDSQLAKNFEASVNGLQTGLFHLSAIPMAAMYEYTKSMLPLVNLFVFPYPHTEIAYSVFDGKGGDLVRERTIKDTGLRPVAFWEVGFRHLTSVKKPIHNLADLKGLKIRVQPNPVHIAAFRALGANPTPIAWGELFTALQQGVVDGAENPFNNIEVARLYEPQSHLTLSGHAFEAPAYLVSEKWYQSLPIDVKTAFDESWIEATKYVREQMVIKDKKYVEFIGAKMAFYDLPEEELTKFRNAVKPSYEISRKESGSDYYDALMGEIQKAEKDFFSNKITAIQ